MRKIKFRAWDKDTRRMYKNDSDLKISIENNGEYIFALCANVIIPPEYIELMQYTGLKDKNGKEIYEGDIVTCSNGMAYQYKVIFSSGCFEGYDNACGFARKLCDMKDLKVIGNIYENPELLEKI